MPTGTQHDMQTLESLTDDLVREAVRDGMIREGVVSTTGPLPYRRLDCDGRALAYLRARPRKNALRVDVSALWSPAWAPSTKIPTASGSTSLLLRSAADVRDALQFLRDTVEKTHGSRRQPISRLRFQ